MTVLIGSWEFEGPFSDKKELRDEPAIYAVLTSVDDEYELVELNETERVKQAFSRLHEVTPEDRSLSIAIYYCSDLTDALREGLVDIILQEFDVPDDIEPNKTSAERFDSHTFLAAANH